MLKAIKTGLILLLFVCCLSIAAYATTVTVYQAEDYSTQAGTTLYSTTAGHTGTGYMVYSVNGYLQWDNINAPADGTYTIFFRYSNASGSNKPCRVFVNNTDIGLIDFPTKPLWTSWRYNSVTAELNAGNNSIKLLADTGAGGPWLDKVEVGSGYYNVEWWEARFLAAWTNEYETYFDASMAADSWKLYNLGYAIDANTTMYLASNAVDRRKYIERALLYINNVISFADVSSEIPTSQYKDAYMGWPELSHPLLEEHGREYPLYESYMWRYVTKLLYVIKNDAALYAAYKKDYDAILAFTEMNMFKKWYNRGLGNLYRSNTHMASHWGTISLYLYNLSTDEEWKPIYQTVYQNIHNYGLPNYNNNSLIKQMKVHPTVPTALFWHQNWGIYDLPGSDISHGGNTIANILEAHEMGYLWTGEHILGFNSLLLNVLWTGNGYPYYVDGSGSGNGWFNEGWVKLGKYDPNIQKKLQSHNVGRNTQLYANGALNAKILGLHDGKFIAVARLTVPCTEMSVGDTGDAAVTGVMSDNSNANLQHASVRYESSNENAASVTAGGKITALAPGVSDITVFVTLDNVTVSDTKTISVKHLDAPEAAMFTARAQNATGETLSGRIVCNEIAGFTNDTPFSVPVGARLQIAAPEIPGKIFKYWKNSVSKRIMSTDTSIEITHGSDSDVTAVYWDPPDISQPLVQFIDRNNKLLHSAYVSTGVKVSEVKPANPFSIGYTFDRWSVADGTEIKSDSVIRALYSKDESISATVTVINGTLGDNETSAVYKYNQLATVSPDPSFEGIDFAYWMRDGQIVSYDYNYSFYAWGDTTVEAVYGETQVILVPRVIMDKNVKGAQDNRAIFMAEHSVPSGFTLIEFGVLLSDASDELTINNHKHKAASQPGGNSSQFAVRVDGVSGTWYARAYLIYEKNGEYKIVYSDAVHN